MSLFLSCHGHDVPETKGIRLHVEDEKASFQEKFHYMCSTLDNCSNRTLSRMLSEIEKIEKGELSSGYGGADAWCADYDKEKVLFEDDYGREGEEIGGEVSLAQFKLAVQAYLQFLEDPERKPIKVPFPEQ
jgi:hypothetical protein